MNLVEIDNQKTWDAFLASQPWSQFTQSWAWGEFQSMEGHAVKRVFVMDGKSVMLACQLIRYDKRFSGYWFAPRGPVFSMPGRSKAREAMSALLNGLLDGRLPGRSLFFRFEPVLTIDEAKGALPMRLRRNHAMTPASTRLLDLTMTEEALLAGMHQKTRYNIRLAAKHEVDVRLGSDAKDLDAFLSLMRETAKRDGVTFHSDRYLRATFDTLATKGLARLRLAEFNGKILAANMEIGFGDTLTYLHGASSSADRQLMAPYLLQWEAIRAGKAEGFKRYDFYGVNPESKASYYYKAHWEGISRFKQGFGGEQMDLVGTWDLPMNRLLYRLVFPEGLARG